MPRRPRRCSIASCDSPSLLPRQVDQAYGQRLSVGEAGRLQWPWVAPSIAISYSRPDRKSDVSGKSVSVRVELGGRRILQKQTQNEYTTTRTERDRENTKE